MTDVRIRCDVAIVGRGSGGAVAAHELAAAGLDVVVLGTPRALHDPAVRPDTVPSALEPHYAVVERLLDVREVPWSDVNLNNRLLRIGAAALGWRHGPLRRAHRELAMNVRYVDGTARRLTYAHGRVMGVVGDGFSVRADRVVLANDGRASARLVAASKLPDPYRQVGRGEQVDWGAVTFGRFEEPIDAWRGLCAWACTESDWIAPFFGDPAEIAAVLPGVGAGRMRQYRHLAASRAIVARPERMPLRLAAAARLLLAAGASEVWSPVAAGGVITAHDQANRIGKLQISALDPLLPVAARGGLCIGEDPARSACDASGRYHHAPNLWVADGSLFSTSTGVPPLLSLLAFGHRVGRAAAEVP